MILLFRCVTRSYFKAMTYFRAVERLTNGLDNTRRLHGEYGKNEDRVITDCGHRKCRALSVALAL